MSKKTLGKKALALIFVLVMLLGMTSLSALAADETFPVLSDVTAGPVSVGDNISATSNEDGTLYLVLSDTGATKADIEAAAVTANGVSTPATADTPAALSTAGFAPDTYVVYAIDTAGNVSDPSAAITVNAAGDTTKPELSDVTAGPVSVGDNISATSNEDGTLYLVPSDTGATKADIEAAANTANGASTPATADTPAVLSTAGFAPDTYVVYAIDTAENVSDPSAAITVNAASEPTKPELRDVTAGPVSVGDNISATSNEDGTLYLVPSDTGATKADIEAAAVTANGSSTPATADTPAALSTAGFAPDTYVVYAIDTAGNVSAPSVAIIVNAAGPTEPQENYLSDLEFSVAVNSMTDYMNLKLSPEFDGATDNYDLIIPDFVGAGGSMNNLYARAPLIFDAPEGCQVYASYEDANAVRQEIEIGGGYTMLPNPFMTSSLVREIEIEVRSGDDVLQSYTVDVKYICTLRGLTVKDSNNLRPLDRAVAYDNLLYAVDVPVTVNNITVSVTGAGIQGTVTTVNGNPGTTLTIQQQNMQWDANGKMDIPIVISNVRFETTTYVLTLERTDVDYIPAIITQPQGANYTQFDEAEPLTVEAQTADTETGVLTYQWYVGEMALGQANDIIAGATSASYIPPTDTVNTKPLIPFLKGNRWYKCVVTYTVNGRAYQAESNVVAIRLTAFVAETPSINVQPSGGEYIRGSVPAPLHVEASVADNGILSYQWYCNDTDSVQGGRLIEGATDIQYVPSADTVGTQYYYCKVTNTVQSLTAAAVTETAAITILPLAEVGGDWAGAGTTDDPYLLEDADDLVLLSDLVNQGYGMANTVFMMKNDVTLPAGWEPIGHLKDGAADPENGINILPFCGVFDGGGKILTIPEDGLPLFNYVREATVRNLNIYGVKIAGYGLINKYAVDYGSDGDYQTGVPATVLIDNVTISSGSSTLYSGFIGGYASGGNTVTIRNCTVEENVVIGYAKNRSAIGSFAGLLNGTVDNCVSYATVYGVNNVGGLIGVKGQAMGICSVKNSAFCGAVVATGSRVGGIAGSGYDGSGTAPNTPVVTIMNCYVAADITGLNQIGGILGAEPGCECCWDNGFGYVSNNHFYGSIRATYPDATEGGIIGFLKSFNKYQGIENNYYLDSCGADSGIGKIETIITKDHAKYGTKFGIDYIFNADEICIASTEEEFADGSITALLNAGGSSTGNWIQGATYPVFADGPVLVGITLSGSYKTQYILGESFSNAGMTVTASYSDGATVPLNLEDVTFSGFDSTVKGVKTITVKYLSAQTSYTVRVTSGESGNTKINVSFSLLGAPADGENGAVHTLSSDNLITWIEEKVYTVSVDATVRVVFETALTEAGLTWSNPSGNYVKSITKDGITLAEFTNGNYSGWMYTLNGTHPLLGIDEQYLNDGDMIVFHYTDDYTKEEGTDKWDNGGTRNAAQPTITPTITVKNGEASAILSEADIDAIINAASENGATNITISAKTDQPVTKSTVVLPPGSVSDIASAGMSLTVETSTGTFDIDNDALRTIARGGSGSVTISAEQLDPASLSEVNRELVGNHPVFDLTITVGGKKIIDFGNGIVTVSLPYTPAAGEDTDNLAVYYIDENGGATEMSGAYYDAATGCIVFKTSHFSKFAVVYHQTWMNPFTDVSESDWYYDSVGYVFKNGLFSGTSPTTFSPDTPMTRAMLVTVLYRLEGLPMVMGTNRFTDVESGQWYTDAVIWANTNGIVEGYDDGRFGPNDNITREQMAAILYRYATYKGYDTSASTDLTAYADMSAVSVWALEAMKWAVVKGLITGMESTTLAPTETATRAQVATLLQRFGENIAK